MKTEQPPQNNNQENEEESQAYELRKLRNAPNAMRRDDWANNIAGYIVNERVKLDRESKEMGLSVTYDGYDDESKIMNISIKVQDELKYHITIDAISGDILVNKNFYKKFVDVFTIHKVINELIEKLQEEFIESL